MSQTSDPVERAKSTPWYDSPSDLLNRVASAQTGDILVTRGLGKMGRRPYLLTKLPVKMSEHNVRREVPCQALGLVLARHEDQQYRDYLLVLCDDFIGWISPDHIDRFLSEDGT